MNPVVALLTDFGTADPYVAQMRGVLAALAPQASYIEISHAVSPFQLAQAAFFLASSAPHFPENTVLLTVVDPGVGTSRRILCVSSQNRLFLGPDNGVMTPALLTPGAEAWDLTPEDSEAHPTFHGRDIFAPLAAHLANGRAPSDLGPRFPVGQAVTIPWDRAVLHSDRIEASILHIDRFGNVILNARNTVLAQAGTPPLSLHHNGQATNLSFIDTYADLESGRLGLLQGSQGFLEIAANMQSAAGILKAGIGDPVDLFF